MTLHHGDCLDVMAGMEPESVDAVVTDPPYDLTSTGARNGSPRSNPGTGPYQRLDRGGFMGKRWDGTGIAFRSETWAAAYRVAKPSAYLLAFGGTRTVHRMTVAIEDAGWVIRDMLVWAYASGFPKSKASLKPAWEPIVMARKPGPLAMLNIDDCRIPLAGSEAPDDREGEPTADTRYGDKVRATPGRRLIQSKSEPSLHAYGGGLNGSRAAGSTDLGRWPANVILTDPIFDGGIEGVVGGGETSSGKMLPTEVRSGERTVFGQDADAGYTTIETYGDSGTYSRFFLIPKADRSDREPLNMLGAAAGGAGLDAASRPRLSFPEQVSGRLTASSERASRPSASGLGAMTSDDARRRVNTHPTVKPVDLMRHLVRLVTPTGGIVLDPFLGSGTTAIACEMEGFGWIGIEREAEYVAIAQARLNGVQKGLGLPA